MKVTTLVLSLTCLLLGNQASAAMLRIQITGIKALEGNMQIALFNSAETFTDTPYEAMSIPVSSDSLEVELTDLDSGEYAVMMFQDLDGDEALDTNLIGIPSEPWGGSLRGKSIMGAPKWSDVKFTVGSDTTTITIELF